MEPIHDERACPGFGSNVLHTVIPHVTTEVDDLGQTWELTLTVKEWGTPTSNGTWMKICALSPSGEFIGGSTLGFPFGSRLVFHQSTGSDGIGLEHIVGLAPRGLDGQVFQLYLGIGETNNSQARPQVEFGQVGNKRQYMVSAPAPRGVQSFTSMDDSETTPFDSTYYVANSGSNFSPCHLSVKFLDENGTSLVTNQVPMAAHSRVAINPGGLKGADGYSAIEIWHGDCDSIHAMRLIEYPSTAVGGRTAVLTTSQ